MLSTRWSARRRGSAARRRRTCCARCPRRSPPARRSRRPRNRRAHAARGGREARVEPGAVHALRTAMANSPRAAWRTSFCVWALACSGRRGPHGRSAAWSVRLEAAGADGLGLGGPLVARDLVGDGGELHLDGVVALALGVGEPAALRGGRRQQALRFGLEVGALLPQPLMCLRIMLRLLAGCPAHGCAAPQFMGITDAAQRALNGVAGGACSAGRGLDGAAPIAVRLSLSYRHRPGAVQCRLSSVVQQPMLPRPQVELVRRARATVLSFAARPAPAARCRPDRPSPPPGGLRREHPPSPKSSRTFATVTPRPFARPR